MISEKIKKNIGRGFLIFGFFIFVLTPFTTVFAFGQTTGHMSGITFVCSNGTTEVPCEGFPLLIQAIRGIVNFIVVDIALPFSVIVIAYVGGEYMFYSDNPSKRSESTKRFGKVAWGIFWILAAWLVINLIMTALPISKDVPLLLNNS